MSEKMTRYEGEPCKLGHGNTRWIRNDRCVVCVREAAKQWRINNPEKVKASRRRGREGERLNYQKKKAVILARQKRYKEKHKEKYRARTQVCIAVKWGRLIKPNACSRCLKQGGKIEGHHPDYNKPLDVIWLCPACHAAEHPRGVNAK